MSCTQVMQIISQSQWLDVYEIDADTSISCNWLGGQAVADEIAAPDFDCAGYANISTSDGVVHGQVKQAGKFSFVRIYESGHEVCYPISLLFFTISISITAIDSGTRIWTIRCLFLSTLSTCIYGTARTALLFETLY